VSLTLGREGVTAAAPVALTDTELRAADLVVVPTDHDIFDWELVVRLAWRVLDTRHRVSAGHHVEYL